MQLIKVSYHSNLHKATRACGFNQLSRHSYSVRPPQVMVESWSAMRKQTKCFCFLLEITGSYSGSYPITPPLQYLLTPFNAIHVTSPRDPTPSGLIDGSVMQKRDGKKPTSPSSTTHLLSYRSHTDPPIVLGSLSRCWRCGSSWLYLFRGSTCVLLRDMSLLNGRRD